MKSTHAIFCAATFGLLVLGGLISPCRAATIASYDFSTDADPNVELINTSSSTVAGSGFQGSGRSTAENFFARGIAITAATDYITFTVSADSGFTLNLDQLDFDYYVQQEDATGGSNGNTFTFETRSSVDGFVSATSGAYSLNPAGVTAPYQNASFDLSGGSYDGLSSIEFRLYVTSDDGDERFNDIARWDNITVTGDVVAAIPEPSAALLGGLGCLLLLRRRRAKA